MIAIPFRSLRFHASSSDWGIVFTRNFPRSSEMDYWPRVSAEISGTLTHEGTLLTWLPHPGTAIYLGYNENLQNLGKTLCNRGTNGQCDPDNRVPPRASYFINDGRQFSLKASYLIRF